jgi:hypothetical protein
MNFVQHVSISKKDIDMKKLLDYDFEFIENLSCVLNRDGTIKEYYPQDSYKNEN